MTENKVIPENWLFCVKKFTFINAACDQSQLSKTLTLWLVARGVYRSEFLKVNSRRPNFQEQLCFQSISQVQHFSFNYWVQNVSSLWTFIVCDLPVAAEVYSLMYHKCPILTLPLSAIIFMIDYVLCYTLLYKIRYISMLTIKCIVVILIHSIFWFLWDKYL